MMVAFIFVALGIVAALWLSVVCGPRSALDVLDALHKLDKQPGNAGRKAGADSGLSVELWDKEEERLHIKRSNLIPLGTVALSLSSLFFTGFSAKGAAACLLLGLALGYLMRQSKIRAFKSRWSEELEYYIPVVMERIVIAVQSGLDIVPALEAMVELDEKAASHGGRSKLDPVSLLLRFVCRLTESGVSFEQALKDVSKSVTCSAVKHAFIHLGVAQREGGELLKPLRELAEATQLQYQDSVEERIASMPVKATMPLLCTFAGLIICFLTTPLVQVTGITLAELPK